MQARLGIILCKFGREPAICLREEAIFVKSQKCPYHVTFELDLDLEHILDAGSSGDHRVQVWWRSSHFCGRRSDLHKTFTDGRTDRQTDGRRTPHDCISSWNELKILWLPMNGRQDKYFTYVEVAKLWNFYAQCFYVIAHAQRIKVHNSVIQYLNLMLS